MTFRKPAARFPKPEGNKVDAFLNPERRDGAAQGQAQNPAASAPAETPLPWETLPEGVKLGNKQVPVRMTPALQMKLDWMVQEGLIRSKMGFMTELLTEAVHRRVTEELMRRGEDPSVAAERAKKGSD